MRNHPVFCLFLLLFTLFFYIILGLSGDIRSEIEKYWTLLLPIYLVYGLIVINTLNNKIPEKIKYFWFILFGVLFRIALIPSEPFLSDDIFRYLWDGRVFAAGINPYKYAPLDNYLMTFRDQFVFSFINFPEIATSYPPVSQIIFLVNNLIGGSILSWKILLLVIEIFLFLSLLNLINKFRLNKFRILIYFYNPLLIIETYSSGHLEIAGVLFFWIAVYLFYKSDKWKSIIFFAVSIMTKFFPLISSIPFLINKFIRKFALLITICLVLVLPFMVGGTLPLPGLFSYINRWEFNGGLFQLCVSILNILEVKEYQWLAANFSGYQETIYINYAFYYKVCAVFLFAGVLLIS